MLPVQMTFEGHNFDIVSGSLAPVVGLWLWRGRAPRAAVWGFNLLVFRWLLTRASAPYPHAITAPLRA